MDIICRDTLRFAGEALDEARELATILRRAEYLCGRMDYFGCDVPDVTDALITTNEIVKDIESSIQNYHENREAFT